MENLANEYGEYYATLLVRNECGFALKKGEEGMIHLPSSLTKRQIYEKWCYTQGYKVKSNAQGHYRKLSRYQLRENDEYLWPEGRIPGPVCSWGTF